MNSKVLERITKTTKSMSLATRKREQTTTVARSGVAKLLRMPSRRVNMPSLRARVAASFIAHGVAVDPKVTRYRTMEFYASSKNDWTHGLSPSQKSSDPWSIAV